MTPSRNLGVCLRPASTALVVALVFGACGHEFEPPDRGERLQGLEASYSPALFDSIQWASDEVRHREGNLIYAEDCRRCHGAVGEGETAYARERNLTVPSLIERDWHLDRLDSLRHSIYVGHEEAMPIYGDGNLSPRQIDAVSAYLLNVLRPEMVGGG